VVWGTNKINTLTKVEFSGEPEFCSYEQHFLRNFNKITHSHPMAMIENLLKKFGPNERKQLIQMEEMKN
jgi:hypothetical protein